MPGNREKPPPLRFNHRPRLNNRPGRKSKTRKSRFKSMIRSLIVAKFVDWFWAGWGLAFATLSIVRYRAQREIPRAGTDPLSANQSALRTIFVHRDLPFHGGVPRCLLYLARACLQSRIDFKIASCIEPSAQMRAAFGELGITPQFLGDNGYLGPMRRLRKIVKQDDIQVIVATAFKAYLCAKFAAMGRNVRVIFWFHAVHGAMEGKSRRLLLRIISKNDPMLFVSRAVLAAQLPAGHRGPQEVIYNGVEDVRDHPDYQPYPAEKRSEFTVPADALLLGYIGEFIFWKDHRTIVAAMDLLAQRGVNAHLLLIGSGELFEQTRALAEKTAAAARIHFLGARPDARRLLGMMDIYVHPSRGEGFGLALVEAMLASRPAIAARDGAFVEYIHEGSTGMLFNPGDPNDLADAIQRMSGNAAAARAMGIAARDYCRGAFDIERFADSVSDFIERQAPAGAFPPRKREETRQPAKVAGSVEARN
jgi:glycosyltransferase involved in cell wall biosynthesis